MSASSRDTRVAIYAYSDAGEGGIVNDRWTLSATRWGRVTDMAGRQLMIGTAGEVQIDVAIEFADEVTLPDNALFVVGGSRYHLRHIAARTRLRKRIAYAQLVNIETYVDDLYYDGIATFDGTYTFNGERNAFA